MVDKEDQARRDKLPSYWPLRQYSRWVQVDKQALHVQCLGETGPTVLFLHGAGASAHSFMDIAPLVAEWARVVVLDLPGHGFSQGPGDQDLSLRGIASTLDRLLSVLKLQPSLLVGHSAGSAVACQMILEGVSPVKGALFINPAVEPFRGLPAFIFPTMARLAASMTWIPRRIAEQTRRYPSWVGRTLRSTGSGPSGARLYQYLAGNERHVAGVVRMMAQWDLRDLEQRIERIAVPVRILVGDKDRAVPPKQGLGLAQRLVNGSALRLQGLGHLAHEEAPIDVARLLTQFSREIGFAPPGAMHFEGSN